MDPAKWPAHRRGDWVEWVNRPQTSKEEQALLQCIKRGRPFGSDTWVTRTARTLGLQSSLRPPGRPAKKAAR
jgi:putative transposase